MRYNPFNPQQPARPSIFVGREPEITIFEKYLSQTMHGSPMNMSVTGNRGMGKTSILVKFEQLAKAEGCLVMRMSNYEGNVTNAIELGEYIITNLKREVLAVKPLGEEWDTFRSWVTSLRPTIGVGDISLKIEREQVIQEMLRKHLLKLWDEIRADFKAVVILIDESESLERIEGALIFLREVFQRVSADANYMVVLAGKLNFPERMSESFSPLNRFFSCSPLMPLSDAEVKEYVRRQLDSVEVAIEDQALEYIRDRSEGHPYVLVAMSHIIFDSLKDNEDTIDNEMVIKAGDKIDARLAQDFFNPMYHPLTPKAKTILRQIAANMKGMQFTFSDAVKWVGDAPNRVSPYIQELVRKGVISRIERGRYEMFHGLFRDFVASRNA